MVGEEESQSRCTRPEGGRRCDRGVSWQRHLFQSHRLSPSKALLSTAPILCFRISKREIVVKIIQQWRISKAWRNSQRLEPRRVCFAVLLSGREGFVAILGSIVVVVLNRRKGGGLPRAACGERFANFCESFCDEDLKPFERILRIYWRVLV